MKTHIDLDYEEFKVVVDNYRPNQEITRSNFIIKYLETNGYLKVKEWLNFDPERLYTEKVVPLMDENFVVELQKILKIFYDLYPEINPEITQVRMINQANNKEYIVINNNNKYEEYEVYMKNDLI